MFGYIVRIVVKNHIFLFKIFYINTIILINIIILVENYIYIFKIFDINIIILIDIIK